MKKSLLFLLLAIASAPAAFAQGGELTSKAYASGGTDARNTGFGVKGGYNLSNFFGTGNTLFTDRDNINTFHAGFYGQFGFNEFSSLQVELLYARKGIRYNINNGGLSDLRLDYVSLPILYVGNITNNFSFHVGPQVSLLTKVLANGNNLDLKNNGFNSIDVGGVLGLEYRVGPARVGARYDLGLARVLKDGSTAFGQNYLTPKTSNDVRITNQTLEIYLGLGITQ